MTVDRLRDVVDVSFLADRRGRVPFALIGVLLLVMSTAYAAGVAEQGLVGEDRDVERAVERVDADTTTALKHAAREAAHAAAAEPVTRATPDGRSRGDDTVATDAVRPGSAFEDAFRLRLAIAAAESLSETEATVGPVTAWASLPAVDDPDDLSEARGRVSVEPVANGTATRVTFRDVRTRATREGRVVADRTRDRTVVVAVPTLAAHERTERFEERLGRGPVEGPGLGRQLTASLYPMTWARGYAQYAGAPVRNVLANRHVELSTNAGIVRTQRDVFGATDPHARGGVARAAAETGLTDLLAPTGLDESSWSETVLDAPTPTGGAGGESETGGGTPGDTGAFAAEDGFGDDTDHLDGETAVAIEHAADVAATAVHDDLGALVRDPYRVEATAESSAVRVVHGGRPRPSSPGREWSRTGGSRGQSVSVVGGSDVPTGTPSGTVRAGRSLSFGSATRSVAVDRRATATWEREVERTDADGNVTVETQRVRTRASTTDRYRVRVTATGTYAPGGHAPARPTTTFGAGGWIDGDDLGDTPADARDDLGVATAGDVDRVARDAVRSGDVSRSTVVFGGRPADLEERVAADIEGLRADVHAIETDVRMGDVAAGEADPYGDLADAIRDRRSALVDAPSTYDGAADRARVSARAAYVDAVVDELETAAEDEGTAIDGLLDRVEGAFGGPSVGEVIASREATRETDPHRVGAGGPGGDVTFVPDGSPGYLPRTAVDGANVEAVDGTTTRPLAVRNLNYVTVPYDEVSGGIVDRILGTEDTVALGVAGRALVTADTALDAAGGPGADPDLRADRDALADRLHGPLQAVDHALAGALGERTSLSRGERREVVDSVAATYDSPGHRAVAVGNGSYADRIATTAADRGSLSSAEEAALAASLRVTLRTTTGRDAVRVPSRFVDAPTERSRALIRDRLEGSVEDGVERAGHEAAERWAPKPVRSVGAGLPVAPVPGYWVATVNAWRVQVRGEYPEFTLHADVGTPDEPFAYTRSAGGVTVDVGGTPVSLGATDPVRFETGTIVVVAVPAGPPGVGDVDGTRDETSPGWPCPGGPDALDPGTEPAPDAPDDCRE